MGNNEQIIIYWDDDLINFYVNGKYMGCVYEKWDIIDIIEGMLNKIEYTKGKDIEIIKTDGNQISWYEYTNGEDIEEFFLNSGKITYIESIALKNKNYELFEQFVHRRYLMYRERKKIQ